MLNNYKYIIILVITAISAAPLISHALCAAPKDLNGVWKSNDGGTYYIRQIGNDVWWSGMSGDNGKSWSNVFKGVKNGNTVNGQWADVPKGRILSGGNLQMNINIIGNGYISEFTKTYQTGGFGGSRWFKDCQDVILNPVP